MENSPWEILKSRLKAQLDPGPFGIWIEPIEVKDQTEQSLVLGLPNQFAQRWVDKHYGSLIRELYHSLTGGSGRLELAVADRPARKQPQNDSRPVQPELPYQPGRLLKSRLCLSPRYTFEHFVTGEANIFAHQAALELASGRGMAVGSLFLQADTGLGKSHLSQAVGRRLLDNRPDNRVLYLSAEDFTNQMVSAIRVGRTVEFKNRFRNLCDSLILEDVQFLTGKEKTQTELANTLDALWAGGKRVIFTSSKTPDQIPGLRRDLASRLSTGLVARIGKPDFETRVRIVLAKARQRSLEIPSEVAEVLAGSIKDDIRRLESALMGVVAKSRYLNRPLSAQLAREEIGQDIRLATSGLELDHIISTVCRYYRLKPVELLSKSRTKRVSEARSVAFYLSRRLTGHSLAEIGLRYERRHSTVAHAVARVEKAIHHQASLGRQALLLHERLEKD